MTELLNCPFCDLSVAYTARMQGRHTVHCTHCQIDGPWADSKAEAITAWNTRPSPNAERVAELEEIKRLRAALTAITNVRVYGHFNIWRGRDICADIARTALTRPEGEG